MSLETTVVEEDIERKTYTEQAKKFFTRSTLALGLVALSVTGCDSAGPEPPKPPEDDKSTISFQATGEAVTPHGNEVEGVAEAYAKGDKRDEEFFTGTFNLNSSVEVTNSVNGNVDPVQVQRDSVPKAREGIGNKSIDGGRGNVEAKAMNQAKTSSQATTNSSDGSLDLRVDVFDEAGHLEKISRTKTVEDGGNFDLGTLNMEYTKSAPDFNLQIDFFNKETGEPLDSVKTTIETPEGNAFSLRDSTGSETSESLSWESARFEIPSDGYSVTFDRRGSKEVQRTLQGNGFDKELDISLEPVTNTEVDVSVNGTLENTFNHTIPNASGSLLVEGQEALSFQSDNQGNVSGTATIDVENKENVELTAVLDREFYQERDTTGTATVQNGEVSMNLGEFLMNYDGSKTFNASGDVNSEQGDPIGTGDAEVALGNKVLADQISNGTYNATTPIADHDVSEFNEDGDVGISILNVDGFQTPADTTVVFNDQLNVDFTLTPEAPDTYQQVIKGNVTDDLGDVVDDGNAVVTSSSGETICDVTTQAFIDGECVDTGEVGNEPDSYIIDIDRVHLENQEVTVPFEDAENADVELPREFYDIEGRSINEGNEGIGDQIVNVTFQDSVLTTTTTDGNGNHTSEVTFYKVTDVENPEGDIVYPESDLYKQATVGFTAQNPDETVDVGETTLLDKLINATFQGTIFNIETNEGISNISVEYLTDQGHSTTTTTNNTGDFSGQLEIAKRNEPSSVDLIVNEAEEQGYESKTVEEPFTKDINRDVGLEKLLQEVNFTIDPYDVRGNEINDLTVSVKPPSGNVQSFLVENGEINVSIEVEDEQEALKIWHDFGNNNKYNDVLMIRQPEQGVPPIAEENIANNNMIEGWSHGEPFDTLSVAASQLDGKQNLEAYLAEYSHDTNVGEVNVNDSDAVELAFGRTNNVVYGYDEVNGIDSLRVLLFEYNVDNPDEDIDPEVINEQEDYLNQILTNLTEHPKVLDYKIDRISDPSELDPYEDENFENTLGIYNRNLANPSNGMGLKGNRFSSPNVNLPESGTTKGVFIEEVTEATAGMDQPPGYGGSSAFTVKVPGGSETAELNSFGETVYNLNLLLNKGTEIE